MAVTAANVIKLNSPLKIEDVQSRVLFDLLSSKSDYETTREHLLSFTAEQLISLRKKYLMANNAIDLCTYL